ncbi:RECQ1 helicase, partial [Acromyrmex heyeri]
MSISDTRDVIIIDDECQATENNEIAAIDYELQQIENDLQKLQDHRRLLTQRKEKLRDNALSKKSFSLSKKNWDNADFVWSVKLTETLKNVFKIEKLRELQLPTTNAIMSKKDMILIMPTGGGKSLCYQLPAVMSKGITVVVVSPLVSLMEDQLRKQKAYELGHLERFAIDEVHCCSQWGHDFRPDYKFLGVLKSMFPGIPILGLTATAPTKIIVDVQKMLDISGCLVLRASFNRPNLYYEVANRPIRRHETCLAMIENLLKNQFNGKSCIIYTTTIKDAEQLTTDLRGRGIKAGCYHAMLEANYRSEVYSNEKKETNSEKKLTLDQVIARSTMPLPNIWRKASNYILGECGQDNRRVVYQDGEALFCKNNVCVHPPTLMRQHADVVHHPGYMTITCKLNNNSNNLPIPTLHLSWIPNSTLRKHPTALENLSSRNAAATCPSSRIPTPGPGNSLNVSDVRRELENENENEHEHEHEHEHENGTENDNGNGKLDVCLEAKEPVDCGDCERVCSVFSPHRNPGITLDRNDENTATAIETEIENRPNRADSSNEKSDAGDRLLKERDCFNEIDEEPRFSYRDDISVKSRSLSLTSTVRWSISISTDAEEMPSWMRSPELLALQHNLVFPESATASPVTLRRAHRCRRFSVDLSEMRSLRLFFASTILLAPAVSWSSRAGRVNTRSCISITAAWTG